MNLFEKMFNYQMMTRLNETGLFTWTSQERAWLRMMMKHQAAQEALRPNTWARLNNMLHDEQQLNLQEYLTEKAKSEENSVSHALLRPLRQMILEGQGFQMTGRIRHGRASQEQFGFPYKLEYSMVKKEWYVLWYAPHFARLMSTKLHSITKLEPRSIQPGAADRYKASIALLTEKRKTTLTVEVLPAFNAELSRILYAFSCFERQVKYNEENHVYRIVLTVPRNELDYVLSKMRFLGKRVRITDSTALRERMSETAAKVLARYARSESTYMEETAAAQADNPSKPK
ncbi:WYL domain-containing protein [Paenibacillus barcinonensis]|uniref:WYL domain-containing protein n=1 Tax=Paenibacillus barcinonensis TaxID=198119 RepID=A0A2V4V9D1_PAEBA|nr:WYL domain-containing protein [Paenibacillus barcinonensis]PYE48602.1 WYL domain-containing protein [Paenibacillus barcinonensis]QKS58709.1 WYL domain-containing protein [Paenibacillus barcinonensis]